MTLITIPIVIQGIVLQHPDLLELRCMVETKDQPQYVSQYTGEKNPSVLSTLPKSNLHVSRIMAEVEGLFQALFSLFSIVFYLTEVKFSLSRSYIFSPNRFDLGRVDCTSVSEESALPLT